MPGGGLVAVASSSASSKAPPGAPQAPNTFAQWLAATRSSAGPTHHLRPLSGVLTAITGGLTATAVNSSDLEFEIEDAAENEWIGHGGTNGAHTLPSPITSGTFTFMREVQFDTAPSQMTLATSGFGTTAGQYLTQVDTDGAGGLKPRVGRKDSNGASVLYVGTNPGTVPVGTTLRFFYLCRLDGTQEVWVHDVSAGTVSQVGLTLNTGTAPGSWDAPPAHTAFIGSNTAGATAFDGVSRDLIIWDGYALTAAEFASLEMVSDPGESAVVWAKELDAGEVNESTALANISVLNHIHPAVGFTLEVTDGTGTRGTLTTPDGQTLTYTANAVTGNQTEGPASLGWRISKGGVNSPTVGFTIDVIDTTITPPPETESDQANCFVESSSNTVVIGSGSGSIASALQSAINNATPGRQILIAAGTYTGGTVTLNNAGTEAAPIVIRPQGSMTSVTINNNDWTFANTSSWLAISKLQFSGGSVKLWGQHNRITRCLFTNFGGNSISLRNDGAAAAKDCRIDHCEFHTAGAGTRPTAINYGGAQSYGQGFSARNLVDYCYFHDITTTQPDDGFAIQGFGHSFGNFPATGYAVARGQSLTVDHCLIDNLNHPGEFIVAKIGGMVWSNNTFLRINGYLQSRAGDNWEVRSNWFELGANGEDFKAWGKNHLWIGNRIVGAQNIWVPCGQNDSNGLYNFIATSASGTQTQSSGVQDDYICAEDCLLIGNKFDTGQILVGKFHAGEPSSLSPVKPAKNNTLEANERVAGGSAHAFVDPSQGFTPTHTGTTVSSTPSMTWTPAVKLTTADVGRSAADPLCG